MKNPHSRASIGLAVGFVIQSVGATLVLGADLDVYVTNGSFIQEFNGQTGAFIGNVSTTSQIDGVTNNELHFGPDNDLYGIGINRSIYKYDFGTGSTSL